MKTRLLFLINSLAPYGAETFVLGHARHADRSRFDVTVCHLGGSRALAGQFAAAGVRVVDLGARGRADPLALARLALLLRASCDVLQTHIAYASVVGRALGRAVRVPVVVSTEQSVRDDVDYGPWLRRAMDATFGLAHANVFISEAVRASFSRAGPVIPNGIAARALAATARAAREEVRAELGLRRDDFAFVQVARLNPRKGQRTAIAALTQVPAAQLFFVGDGEDLEPLRAHAAARGLAGRVRFLGQRLDVPRLLGGFDACVHPALTEGLGVAVLEAMAAGLPVVATRTGGIPEFARDGDTAWLVPPGDAGALAARMAQLASRADADLAGRGQALVLDRYDLTVTTAAYQALYTELL